MLRTFVSGTLLATTALVAAVDSSTAWPQFADLRAANYDLIVPVQMRGGGGGMAGGGMAGGGMAGAGAAGGGMAGVAKGGMGAGAKGDVAGAGAKGGMAAKGSASAGAKGGMAGAGGKGTAGVGTKGGMAGAGAKGTAGAKGGTVGKGGGTVGVGGGNVNVNVHGTSVRPWVQRPYFGTVIGGVALGSVIAASAAPAPPADNLCWIWTSAEQTQGYWDYCTPP
jgi:hypothetical protein